MAVTTPSTLDNNLTAGGTNSQALATWAAPYVTDMLGKSQALAAEPFQAYQGPLTADQSGLQTQAFQGLAGLTVPEGIGQAATTAGNIATNLADQSYSPSTFGSQYTAPAAYQGANFFGDFTQPAAYQTGAFQNAYVNPADYQSTNFATQYAAPTAYQATTVANEYKAPTDYQTGTFTNQFAAPANYQNTSFANQYAAPVGQSFTTADAQKYMSPYLQASLDPQIAEARRQAQITQAQNAAKGAQSGAFGGSRQAIMDAETQRSLGTNLANITGQGYNTAFTNAQQQFNAEQARKVQEAQLQAQYGLSAAQAAEASKQFGSQQGMTAAQLAAQYGLSSQQALEASRQFGSQQKMTAAQLMAQYGLSADQANIAEKQFGSQQGMTASQLAAQYGLSSQQATEASKQFGTQQKMTEAQLQAQYGLSAAQAAEASRQFGSQQGLTAAQIAAQYSLAEKQAAEASKQFGAQQGMTASQLAAQYGLSGQQASEASKQFGANYGLQAQQAALQAAQAQATMASLQNQTGLNNISALLSGGAAQRGITAEGIAADKAAFEQQRQYPQDMLKFQQAMLTGLPMSSVTNTPGQMSDLGSLLAGLGGATALGTALGYGGNANTPGYGAVGDLLKSIYGSAGTATNAVTNSDWYKQIFG
jgi:hypothetical protein